LLLSLIGIAAGQVSFLFGPKRLRSETMSLAPAHFTRETFTALLRAESLRCIRVAVERRWQPPVPEVVLYYFPAIDYRLAFSEGRSEVVVPPGTLFREEELLPHLFREEDGHFRWEIVLSPFAVTGQATVIEVSLRDPGWTDKVITGEHAFPHEPFQLHGPALPPSWREGEPTPKVLLPRLRTGSLPVE
jgi:hypothetical protein